MLLVVLVGFWWYLVQIDAGKKISTGPLSCSASLGVFQANCQPEFGICFQFKRAINESNQTKSDFDAQASGDNRNPDA
tara:strand:- start:877 stop:1110 length:234 start_codon:yes stop_codon:yes gene_type:complete